MNYTLVTVEITLVIVAPLLFLYLRSSWPLRVIIPCLLSIPLLWYLTYSPLHELSHVVGTYLVGGTVTSIKLIPRFWVGEFGRAWITPEGLTQPWQQLIMTASPYLVDVLCLAASMFILQRRLSANAFVIGLLFMLLCLRPAFDFLCETTAFLLGHRGDLFHIEQKAGTFILWLSISTSLAFSMISIVIILKRFLRFPDDVPLVSNFTNLPRIDTVERQQ